MVAGLETGGGSLVTVNGWNIPKAIAGACYALSPVCFLNISMFDLWCSGIWYILPSTNPEPRLINADASRPIRCYLVE
jgi:hypothetical protein